MSRFIQKSRVDLALDFSVSIVCKLDTFDSLGTLLAYVTNDVGNLVRLFRSCYVC